MRFCRVVILVGFSCEFFMSGCGSAGKSTRSSVTNSDDLKPQQVVKKSQQLVPDSFESVDISTAEYSLRPQPGYSVVWNTPDIGMPSVAFEKSGLSKSNISPYYGEILNVNYAGQPVPVYLSLGGISGEARKQSWTVKSDKTGKFFKIEGYFDFAIDGDIDPWGKSYQQKYLTAVFRFSESAESISKSSWNKGRSTNILENKRLVEEYISYKFRCSNLEDVVYKFLGNVWDYAGIIFQTQSHLDNDIRPEKFRAAIIVLSNGPIN